MHKITNLWKFGLTWSSKLQELNERKNTFVSQICVLSDAYTGKRLPRGLKSFIIWVRNYLSLKTYVTSDGADSHIVLNYQQLSIARYQVSFFANNYFEYPIVSSAFKQSPMDW